MGNEKKLSADEWERAREYASTSKNIEWKTQTAVDGTTYESAIIYLKENLKDAFLAVKNNDNTIKLAYVYPDLLGQGGFGKVSKIQWEPEELKEELPGQARYDRYGIVEIIKETRKNYEPQYNEFAKQEVTNIASLQPRMPVVITSESHETYSYTMRIHNGISLEQFNNIIENECKIYIKLESNSNLNPNQIIENLNDLNIDIEKNNPLYVVAGNQLWKIHNNIPICIADDITKIQLENKTTNTILPLSDEEIKNILQKEDQVKLRMIQKFSAELEVLHDSNYAHRDIKPANIIIDNTSSNNKLSIIDYGGMRKNNTIVHGDDMSYTPGYCSKKDVKEENNKRVISQKQDIFSLGVSCMQVLFGQNACGNIGKLDSLLCVIDRNEKLIPEKLAEFINKDSVPEWKKLIVNNLIMHMLSTDPEKRPNIHSVVMALRNINKYNYNNDYYQKIELADNQYREKLNHCHKILQKKDIIILDQKIAFLHKIEEDLARDKSTIIISESDKIQKEVLKEVFGLSSNEEYQNFHDNSLRANNPQLESLKASIGYDVAGVEQDQVWQVKAILPKMGIVEMVKTVTKEEIISLKDEINNALNVLLLENKADSKKSYIIQLLKAETLAQIAIKIQPKNEVNEKILELLEQPLNSLSDSKKKILSDFVLKYFSDSNNKTEKDNYLNNIEPSDSLVRACLAAMALPQNSIDDSLIKNKLIEDARTIINLKPNFAKTEI